MILAEWLGWHIRFDFAHCSVVSGAGSGVCELTNPRGLGTQEGTALKRRELKQRFSDREGKCIKYKSYFEMFLLLIQSCATSSFLKEYPQL